MTVRSFVFVFASLLACSPMAIADSTQSVTANDIMKNQSNLLGKQVSYTGKIDRVLGNGAYLVSDSTSGDNRILILSRSQGSTASSSSGSSDQQKQQAGTIGQNFKEGDQIKLSGKLEQLNVSSETDTFSPSTNTETVNAQAANLPVIVVQPGSVQKSS